jgi:hypothetical protein
MTQAHLKSLTVDEFILQSNVSKFAPNRRTGLANETLAFRVLYLLRNLSKSKEACVFPTFAK